MSVFEVSRRRFLAQAAAAGVALRFGAAGAQEQTPVVVKTKLGSLRGVKVGGAKVFKGVPFAEPPVGAGRFRAPVAKKAWTGERDATQFAAEAMQPGDQHVPQSEDCLYLNVWAPEGKGPFPVFVWIHGGGFTGGRSFDPVFDGTKFAKAGIVCVTVAYRLGVFGFLDVESLLGAGYKGSANNGLRDLIAALEWVKAHIGDFGGDAGKVTIGGESAGAKLSDLLMGIPAAQPLFNQVISESGGAERVWAQANSALVAKGFGELWTKSAGGDTSGIQSADAGKLIGVQQQFIEQWPQHFPLRAEIDGVLVPRLPVETIAGGSTRGKRLLIGTNRDESALFVGPHPTKNATAADLGNITLEQFEKVYPHYAELYPELTVEQRRIRALSAEEYWIPSMRVLDAHVKAGGKAWDYRLDFAETSGRLKGYAFHSLDIPLVWDSPHTKIGNEADEASLADKVHAAWVAFIQGKTPAAAGLPEWPEYKSDTRATMILDTQSRLEQKPLEAEMRLWDGVL